jgi:hypothetical protein
VTIDHRQFEFFDDVCGGVETWKQGIFTLDVSPGSVNTTHPGPVSGYQDIFVSVMVFFWWECLVLLKKKDY